MTFMGVSLNKGWTKMKKKKIEVPNGKEGLKSLLVLLMRVQNLTSSEKKSKNCAIALPWSSWICIPASPYNNLLRLPLSLD